MKWLLLLTLACAVCAVADEFKDATAQDQRKLQGTWQFLEEVHGDAEPAEEGKLCQLIFDGDKFTVTKEGKAILSGTFKIDASKSPRQIDLEVLKDEEEQRNGQKSLGIYELKGDKLRLCASEPGRDQRPEKFSTKGTDDVIVTLERAKK